MNRLLMIVVMLIALLSAPQSAASQDGVTIPCPPNDQICELEFRITQLEGLIYGSGSIYIPMPLTAEDFFQPIGQFVSLANGIPPDRAFTLVCRQYSDGMFDMYLVLQCGWVPQLIP